jgi:hypothetical protein
MTLSLVIFLESSMIPNVLKHGGSTREHGAMKLSGVVCITKAPYFFNTHFSKRLLSLPVESYRTLS